MKESFGDKFMTVVGIPLLVVGCAIPLIEFCRKLKDSDNSKHRRFVKEQQERER